jgi:integration host factor subunit beta
MVRSDLVRQLKKTFPHLTEATLGAAVTIILGSMVGALEQGRRIELRGFGAMSVRCYPGRSARNPKTGAIVLIPKKRVALFKCSQLLKDRLNGARVSQGLNGSERGRLPVPPSKRLKTHYPTVLREERRTGI